MAPFKTQALNFNCGSVPNFTIAIYQPFMQLSVLSPTHVHPSTGKGGVLLGNLMQILAPRVEHLNSYYMLHVMLLHVTRRDISIV